MKYLLTFALIYASFFCNAQYIEKARIKLKDNQGNLEVSDVIYVGSKRIQFRDSKNPYVARNLMTKVTDMKCIIKKQKIFENFSVE